MTDGILPRLASGDGDAMRDCIDQYGNLVWSIARRFFSDNSTAEDVVQEIFTEIWSKASSYKPDLASESTFIALIARRRTIDAFRKISRKPTMEELPDAEILGASEEESPTPARIDHDTLRKLLIQLPEDTRTMIELSVRDGFTHQEIATRMNLPLGTVKTKIRRGLLELRQKAQFVDGPFTTVKPTTNAGVK